MRAVKDADVDLMLRVKEGDEEAFRVLYRKHSPRVLQFVRRFLGSSVVADDLTQDVFVQLYRARRRYRPEARFSTWLYTIATNVCRNERRRSKNQGRVLVQAPERGGPGEDVEPGGRSDATAEEGAAVRELEDRLRDALAGLPDKQRTAILLSRVDGLAYRDVGRVLKCSEGAVKALLFRAKRSLKRELSDVLGTGRE